jgi:PKHD-type hydroxylase
MRTYRLFSAEEAAEIAADLTEWEVGLAATPFATGTVKKNEEIQAVRPDGEVHPRAAQIHDRIKQSPLWQEHVLRHVMVPKFNRFRDGGEYQDHADSGWLGGKIRTDLACTVFLNDDYEGGELCANGLKIKGPPGTCVVYECWRPHHVAPVTKGERICAITWMQSLIPDYTKIEMMQMLQSVMSDIDRQSSEQRLYARLSSVYGKLMRMWMN